MKKHKGTLFFIAILFLFTALLLAVNQNLSALLPDYKEQLWQFEQPSVPQSNRNTQGALEKIQLQFVPIEAEQIFQTEKNIYFFKDTANGTAIEFNTNHDKITGYLHVS